MLKNTINNKPIRICADILAIYKNKIVLIKRLNDNLKLALPGGGQEGLETLSHAAIREMKEETGLSVKIIDVLGTYTNHDDRKDRHSITTVFIAKAVGKIKNENHKTEVILFTTKELKTLLNSKAKNKKFAFSHDILLGDYFKKYDNK